MAQHWVKKGKIKLLRTNDTANLWGAPPDQVRYEVIVRLDLDGPDGDWACGFDLHEGDATLPSRVAMHSVLRDAYFHDEEVTLHIQMDEGKKNGLLRRVELGS